MTTNLISNKLTIVGIECERTPKSAEEKLRKIDALARIPEQAFESFSADDLRVFAAGLIKKTRAPKKELIAQLLELTKDRRNMLIAQAAQAVADLASMQIKIEDIALLINTCDDPGEVAELVHSNFATRFAPSTISKRITPALTKLLHNNPAVDPDKAVGFKKRWLDLVRPTTTEINKSYSEAVANQHRDLEQVGHEEILNFIETTLIAANTGKPLYWVAVAFALIGATGRRPCEIMSKESTYSYVDSRLLLFDGQAKTKTREDVAPYTIPTIVDAELCLGGIRWLEAQNKRGDFTHAEVNRKYSKSFSCEIPKSVRAMLAKTGLHRPYEFRHFYACYLNEIFNQCKDRPCVSSRAFLSRILGHGANDISTSSAYESKRIRVSLSPEEEQEWTSIWYRLFD
jgi:integrase